MKINEKSSEDYPRMKFSDSLKSILIHLESQNNYVAFELMDLIGPDEKKHNGLKISYVDVSEKDYCFDVVIDDKIHEMKIGKFIRYYFGNLIKQNEIVIFSKLYNELKNGEPESASSNSNVTPIVIELKGYNPKDVKYTFLSLTTKTYPHGHEKELLKFLPSLKTDSVGNYYKIIGSDKPETMFTSHLDTADREQKITKLYSSIENDEEYIITDDNSILGADDKAGVTVMLYMMAHNVPGLYYFFLGEERGGIGSGKLADIYDNVDYLKNIKRCISFDRRDYHSVITHQFGRRCCSDEFGTALCKEYNNNGLDLSLDTTGVFTDSAQFIDNISECTNVSVGYMHEHTTEEWQNITYLKMLCEASVKVKWNSLPSSRKVGIDPDLLSKHKNFIDDIMSSVLTLETSVRGDENGNINIYVDLDGCDIDSINDGLISIQTIMLKYKMDLDILFEDSSLKIEIKSMLKYNDLDDYEYDGFY